MNLTQFKIIRGINIVINGIEYGTEADVSEMFGECIVEGTIICKHNHTLDTSIKIVESLDKKKKENTIIEHDKNKWFGIGSNKKGWWG